MTLKKKTTQNRSIRDRNAKFVQDMFSGTDFTEFELAMAMRDLKPLLDVHFDDDE